ncbi:hypothetical protein PHYSODRAFT_258805 [Phytophthora sojae]|uniref:CCHC-type domain-containing protein n=1 Tax=Phytophthora sojae (strain P6497) TaxID=1094619 RepID=G4ZVV2_PHYSP|nr:hypothetical protein PHYSODRAFT_258805 [Phytophthora sojae]EGZ12288.1 hypothetical protein PHYSODRAFT_258805 [Phytophthora sojae]|eukprot:XP_009532621.1 hypothetical protein PHYSODRAFT_258805 [Phytophthora sojae]
MVKMVDFLEAHPEKPKELEVKYRGGDAGGVLVLRRQWDRSLASNWDNLGDFFTKLKKARNEINRKMSTLVGKEMVTEHWLCMEVLAQLPSMFWGSSITMTEEEFTVENVEVSLRGIFGDESKKEIMDLTNKRCSVVLNVAKKFTRKKRTHDQAEARSSGCYYCFEDGHRKKECPVVAKDRDPERAGGPLFRSKIRTAPSTKKKRVMAVKKGKAAKKPEAAGDEEMTQTESNEYEDKLKKAIEETDQCAFKEPLPVSDGDEEEKPFTQMDIDNELTQG